MYSYIIGVLCISTRKLCSHHVMWTRWVYVPRIVLTPNVAIGAHSHDRVFFWPFVRVVCGGIFLFIYFVMVFESSARCTSYTEGHCKKKQHKTYVFFNIVANRLCVPLYGYTMASLRALRQGILLPNTSDVMWTEPKAPFTINVLLLLGHKHRTCKFSGCH